MAEFICDLCEPFCKVTIKTIIDGKAELPRLCLYDKGKHNWHRKGSKPGNPALYAQD